MVNLGTLPTAISGFALGAVVGLYVILDRAAPSDPDERHQRVADIVCDIKTDLPEDIGIGVVCFDAVADGSTIIFKYRFADKAENVAVSSLWILDNHVKREFPMRKLLMKDIRLVCWAYDTHGRKFHTRNVND